jgi:hypothetical protein
MFHRFAILATVAITAAMNYRIVSGSLFVIFAVAHLVRALAGISLTIGGREIGMAPSWLAVTGAGLLAFWAFRPAR